MGAINISTRFVRGIVESGEAFENLCTALQIAKANDLERYETWYTDMHNICIEIAEFYNLPVKLVVGLMAVLSPQTGVTGNVNAVIRVIESYRRGLHCENATIAGYPANKRKAFAMLKTSEVFPHLSGDKVVPFYNNILNYDSPEYVTIDRHAIVLALYGYTGKASGSLKIDSVAYNLIADVYRQVAAEFGYLPSALQAITWTLQAAKNQFI